MPKMRRARGYRLYDGDGRRYLDLWLDGGGALLGHRGSSAVAEMKSAISRGLVARVASFHEARMTRALERAFPAYRSVRLYSCRCRVLEAVSRYLGRRVEAADVHDPAIEDRKGSSILAAYWRPYTETAVSAEALIPILPFTIGGAPAAVCFREELSDEDLPSDRLPGFVLAGARKAFEHLALSRSPDPCAGLLLDGSRGWIRKGPYVRAAFDPAEYPAVFSRFLSEGVVLFPGYPGPSILPAECSPGELKLLADLFARIPGG
jgi:hypothetical protein